MKPAASLPLPERQRTDSHLGRTPSALGAGPKSQLETARSSPKKFFQSIFLGDPPQTMCCAASLSTNVRHIGEEFH